jgi:hypothetical protein
MAMARAVDIDDIASARSTPWLFDERSHVVPHPNPLQKHLVNGYFVICSQNVRG